MPDRLLLRCCCCCKLISFGLLLVFVVRFAASIRRAHASLSGAPASRFPTAHAPLESWSIWFRRRRLQPVLQCLVCACAGLHERAQRGKAFAAAAAHKHTGRKLSGAAELLREVGQSRAPLARGHAGFAHTIELLASRSSGGGGAPLKQSTNCESIENTRAARRRKQLWRFKALAVALAFGAAFVFCQRRRFPLFKSGHRRRRRRLAPSKRAAQQLAALTWRLGARRPERPAHLVARASPQHGGRHNRWPICARGSVGNCLLSPAIAISISISISSAALWRAEENLMRATLAKLAKLAPPAVVKLSPPTSSRRASLSLLEAGRTRHQADRLVSWRARASAPQMLLPSFVLRCAACSLANELMRL